MIKGVPYSKNKQKKLIEHFFWKHGIRTELLQHCRNFCSFQAKWREERFKPILGLDSRPSFSFFYSMWVCFLEALLQGAWITQNYFRLKPSLSMKILTITNFTVKLLSKILSDLSLGVHLKSSLLMAFVFLAPGYWRLFLNIIIFSQWKNDQF